MMTQPVLMVEDITVGAIPGTDITTGERVRAATAIEFAGKMWVDGALLGDRSTVRIALPPDTGPQVLITAIVDALTDWAGRGIPDGEETPL